VERCSEEARPWSAQSDEELIVEYARNETREAFEELVHRYEVGLYSYLRNYLGDAGLAEDAFQTAFLEVHLRRREFDPNRRFRPWLYRIAMTKAIDLVRRNRRHKLASLDAPQRGRAAMGDETRRADELVDMRVGPPSERLEASEEAQRLRSLVDSLPERQKDVMVLVMYRGLPYREVADLLKIPLGTVKSRVYEAVRHLRKIGAVAA
jgi:RNA polymerase sigma-70 factor (ECF subfamily)